MLIGGGNVVSILRFEKIALILYEAYRLFLWLYRRDNTLLALTEPSEIKSS